MSIDTPPIEPPVQKTPLLEDTAYGYPRDFLDNRFVYLVISPRARGLSIGVNLNPNQYCNFDCLYCEVSRNSHGPQPELDLPTMAAELEKTLAFVNSGQIRQKPRFARLNDELLKLRHVALSGDGEPTLCPQFSGAVETVVHLRALRIQPYFKMVLLTNGAGLDLPTVQEGLQYFTLKDDIWIKLDAGTQAYMDKVNRGNGISLEKILQNTLALARQRPVIIQSLFPLIDGKEPPPQEIDEYIRRLTELKEAKALISEVQIYSATRPMARSGCTHMPLKSLSNIRRRIRTETGLKAEIF